MKTTIKDILINGAITSTGETLRDKYKKGGRRKLELAGNEETKDNVVVLNESSSGTGSGTGIGPQQQQVPAATTTQNDSDKKIEASPAATTTQNDSDKKIEASPADMDGLKNYSKGYWLSNGIGAGINLLSGITGAVINNATNRKYLGKMEELIGKMKHYDIPLTKLKTHYNINPQLSEIDNALRVGKKDIDANTANSQVALARKRAMTLNSVLQKNKLHGQKENIETELINKDRLQQGETIARNIQNAQNVENEKLKLLAGLIDKRAENATATINNITGAVSSAANSIGKAYDTYSELIGGLSRSPDGAAAAMGSYSTNARNDRKAQRKGYEIVKDSNGKAITHTDGTHIYTKDGKRYIRQKGKFVELKDNN